MDEELNLEVIDLRPELTLLLLLLLLLLLQVKIIWSFRE